MIAPHYCLDAAKRKIRRSEESILTLQQERQELLEKNAKSEKLIQSLQVCNIYLFYIYIQDLFIRLNYLKQNYFSMMQMIRSQQQSSL